MKYSNFLLIGLYSRDVNKDSRPRPGPRTGGSRARPGPRTHVLSLRTTKDQGQGQHPCYTVYRPRRLASCRVKSILAILLCGYCTNEGLYLCCDNMTSSGLSGAARRWASEDTLMMRLWDDLSQVSRSSNNSVSRNGPVAINTLIN